MPKSSYEPRRCNPLGVQRVMRAAVNIDPYRTASRLRWADPPLGPAANDRSCSRERGHSSHHGSRVPRCSTGATVRRHDEGRNSRMSSRPLQRPLTALLRSTHTVAGHLETDGQASIRHDSHRQEVRSRCQC